MDPIEEAIRRAQERGAFDHLPGAGKPLDVRDPPFVPPEWRLAYHMLANSGFAPDVVEHSKVLSRDVASIEERRKRFLRRWQAWLQHAPWSPAEQQRYVPERRSFLQQYEADLRALNLRVHAYNATAPTAMHRGGIAVARLLDEAARSMPLPDRS
jgi:DnaJ family protein C protein 28